MTDFLQTPERRTTRKQFSRLQTRVGILSLPPSLFSLLFSVCAAFPTIILAAAAAAMAAAAKMATAYLFTSHVVEKRRGS